MKPEDYRFRDYDNMDRRSPELSIEHALGTLTLNYLNTYVFTFYPPYEFFDYVVHATEDDNMTMLDSPDLVKQLQEYRFPEYKRQHPDVEEVANYFEWHSKVLEQELKDVDGQVADDELEDIEDEDEDEHGYGAWGWD